MAAARRHEVTVPVLTGVVADRLPGVSGDGPGSISRRNSSPNHPQTWEKIERFHQTLKKWLAAQPEQHATIPALQILLDRFSADYNTRRPHRSWPGAPRSRPTRPPEGHRRRHGPAHTTRHPGPSRPRPHLRCGHPAPPRAAAPHRHRTNRRFGPYADVLGHHTVGTTGLERRPLGPQARLAHQSSFDTVADVGKQTPAYGVTSTSGPHRCCHPSLPATTSPPRCVLLRGDRE
jgi:Integrase core domain